MRQLHPLLLGVVGAATQRPLVSQTKPSTQSSTDAQVVLHAVPSQTYGAQSCGSPTGGLSVRRSVQTAPDLHVDEATSQVFPGAQSASLMQRVLQESGPHA